MGAQGHPTLRCALSERSMIFYYSRIDEAFRHRGSALTFFEGVGYFPAKQAQGLVGGNRKNEAILDLRNAIEKS